MNTMDDAEFERSLARSFLTPNTEAASVDHMTPLMKRFDQRVVQERLTLIAAGLVGAAITGGIVGALGSTIRLGAILHMQLRLPAEVGGSDLNQWIMPTIVLAVVAVAGLGGSVRER